MIPVPDQCDGVMTAYQSIVDKLNSAGPAAYEIITIVTVNKPSKSSAFLKLLSSTPETEAIPASDLVESNLEVFFQAPLAGASLY